MVQFFVVCLSLAFVSQIGVSQLTPYILQIDKPFGDSCPRFNCLEIYTQLIIRRGTPWIHGNHPDSCMFFDGWVEERRLHAGQRAPKAAAVYRTAAALLQGAKIADLDTSPLTEAEIQTLIGIVTVGSCVQHHVSLSDDYLDQYITSRGKLLHDVEQLSYLLIKGKLPGCFWKLVSLLTQALEGLTNEHTTVLSPESFDRIGWFYNSFVYHSILPKVDRVTSPKFDFKLAAAQYHLNSPNLVVADSLFSEEALKSLNDYMLESTLWFEFKGGYFGAYFYDGLVNPILDQLVQDLRAGFPDIIGDLPVVQQWAYKLDQNASSSQNATGIRPHADDALVNVNIWIVSDEANNEPSSGGLELVLKESDKFDYDKYNNMHDPAFLNRDGFDNAPRLTVPYKQNRIVMFKSTLVHSSHNVNFKPGYASRRINLTFLFGDREKRCTTTVNGQCAA